MQINSISATSNNQNFGIKIPAKDAKYIAKKFSTETVDAIRKMLNDNVVLKASPRPFSKLTIYEMSLPKYNVSRHFYTGPLSNFDPTTMCTTLLREAIQNSAEKGHMEKAVRSLKKDLPFAEDMIDRISTATSAYNKLKRTELINEAQQKRALNNMRRNQSPKTSILAKLEKLFGKIK